jgi:hypothetical protein
MPECCPIYSHGPSKQRTVGITTVDATLKHLVNQKCSADDYAIQRWMTGSVKLISNAISKSVNW